MSTYSHGFSVGISELELQKACGVSYKTISRMRDPYNRHAPNLDSIDTVARFFKVPTWQMLQPRPPAVNSAGSEVILTTAPPKVRK